MNRDRLIRWTAGTARYGTVSLICFLTNNLLLIGLDALGLPLWLTLVISSALLIVLGFVLQARITFASPLSWAALGRYTLVMLPNVPIAYLLLWLLRDRLGIAMVYAAPAVTTLMVIWNGIGSIWALRRRAPASDTSLRAKRGNPD